VTTNWDALLASTPLNATAGRVVSRSEQLAPSKATPGAMEWDAPPAFVKFVGSGPQQPNLIGTQRGRLTVVGYLGSGKWCARCACGTYVSRSHRALTNPLNEDRCSQCRHTAYLQRETGAERTKQRRQNGDVALPGLTKGPDA
jgi:hypothetical protein